MDYWESMKAIETALEGIEICKRFKIGNALPILLYNYVWNKEKLIEKGVLSPENKRECINYLIQAYYIASAMQQSYMEEFIKSYNYVLRCCIHLAVYNIGN